MNIAQRQPIIDRVADVPAEFMEYEQVPGQAGEPAFHFDVRRLYAILRRNLLLIVAVLAVAAVVGVVATMLTTPKYIASSSVQIDQETARVLTSSDDPDAATGRRDDADMFLQTQIDILKSRSMAQRVSRQLRLANSQQFFDSMGVKAKVDALAPDRRERLSEDVIRNALDVSLPRSSRIVTVSFTSPDPQLAARMVNTYVRNFIESNLQRKYDSSSYARDFLSRQLADSKGRLERPERALDAYARQAGLIRTEGGGGGEERGGGQQGGQSVTTASLMQLNEVANQARATRIAAEQKWHTASSTPLLSIPEVISNSAISALLQQRAAKTAELRDESAKHKDDYPTVQQLRAQIGELNTQIQSLATAVKDGIRDQYQTALQQEHSLNRDVSSLKSATLSEQDAGVQYSILAREADTNRTMYNGLLQRFKELSASAGLANNNISIVDEGEVPSVPSSPKLLLNLGLAIAAGLVLAALLIFLREQIDDAIRLPEDAERKLELPLLGIVPLVRDDVDLLAELQSPRTALAEAYHALRTSLIYSTPRGLPRSILVTSSQPAEGKSTTSFAIALDLARLGKRVILVDTDLRRPSLHRTLGVGNTSGLVDLITGQDTNPAVSISWAENLTFIPSGPVPPNPSELLSSPAMRELLLDLRERYDVVVLDGPPVLGLADAPVLAALAEATVFVVEAGRNHRGGAKNAVRRLRTAHSQLLGCILTKFDPRKTGGGQYYGYEYYDYGSDGR